MQVLHTAIFAQYWSNRKTKTAHSGRHIASNTRTTMVGSPRSAHSTLISQPQHATRPDIRDDRWAPSTNRSSVSDAHAGVGSDPSHAPHPHPSRVRGRAMTPRAPTDAQCEVLPGLRVPRMVPRQMPESNPDSYHRHSSHHSRPSPIDAAPMYAMPHRCMRSSKPPSAAATDALPR
jgi:hypothetical protein